MPKFVIDYSVNRVRVHENKKRVDPSEGKRLSVVAQDYGEAWAKVVAEECKAGLKSLSEVEVNDPASVAHGDGILLTQTGFSQEQ